LIDSVSSLYLTKDEVTLVLSSYRSHLETTLYIDFMNDISTKSCSV